MNELALICDRIGIATTEVLAAANTKWNFLPFTPGLVGGHCVSVDPYYLTAKAELLGYHPEVILAGRRINDGMGVFVAQRLIKLLIAADQQIKRCRIGIFGLAFKENVPDFRNSRVLDIISELEQFGAEPIVHDPLVDPADAREAVGIELAPLDRLVDLDALILAVPHREFLDMPREQLFARVKPEGVLLDVKSLIDRSEVPADRHYWSL